MSWTIREALEALEAEQAEAERLADERDAVMRIAAVSRARHEGHHDYRGAAASLYGEKDAARLYPVTRATDHEIDAAWPPRGPCDFCGDPDARHRIFDAIASRHRAGESVVELAEDFKVSADAVRLALAHREGGA